MCTYDPSIAAYPAMFPGQGSQYVGMIPDVCVAHSASRALLDEASAVLGRDVVELCNSPAYAEQLDSTTWSQPAIFVCSLARAALHAADPAHSLSVHPPSVALGLSLGEYSALCFAGALTFADGLRLAVARGLAMQRACSPPNPAGGLTALSGLSSDAVAAACARVPGCVQVATHLSPLSCVVGGEQVAVAELVMLLIAEYGAEGCRATPLTVAGAFHTPLMAPASEELAAAIAAAPLRAPTTPVLSTYGGRTVCYQAGGVDTSDDAVVAAIRKNLLLQLTQPVQWEQTVGALVHAVGAGARNGVNPHFQAAIELGPGNSCAAILKKFNRRLKVTSY